MTAKQPLTAQAAYLEDAPHLYDQPVMDIASSLDGYVAGGQHYYPLIAQYEDTDAGGIIYHSNYINFAERGRSAWLRLGGIDLQAYLRDSSETFVIRHMDVDFMRSAKLNDKLVVVSSLERLSGVRAIIDQKIFGLKDGHIFARVVVEGVWVNLETGPCRFPDQFRAQMTAIAGQAE